MTVAVEISRVVATGNGATTVWPFNFPLFDTDDLDVYLYEIATGLTTGPINPVLYTVSAVPAASGTVTYPLSGDPLANTHKIIIMRDTPMTQPLDFKTSSGFDPDALEEQLDKMTMMIQETADGVSRAVKINVAGEGDADQVMQDLQQALAQADASADAAAASAVAADASADSAAQSAIDAQAAAATLLLRVYDNTAALQAATVPSNVNLVLVNGQSYERITDSYWDLGPELLATPDLSSATGWTVNTGWAIAGGVGTHTPGNTGSLSQSNKGVVGRAYLMKFTVATLTAGSVAVWAGLAQGVARTAPGTYYDIKAQSNDTLFRIAPSSDFAGTVDNPSFRALPASAVQSLDGQWWGLAAQKFTSLVPNSFPRPVIHKLRERLTPLDLMASGGLDRAIRNGEVTSADAGTITPLFQEAFAYIGGRRIGMHIPGGDYYLNTEIVPGGPVCVYGEGMPNSRVIWTSGAASSGFRVESQGLSNQSGSLFNRTTMFKDLALLTQGLHVGTALTIDQSDSVSGGDTLVDRTTPRAIIEDVLIQGATALNVDAWDGGIHFIDCQGTIMRGTHFLGYQTVFGDPNDSSFGYKWSGVGRPSQVFIQGCDVSAAIIGYQHENYEGVYMQECDSVSCDTGIQVLHTTADKEPQFVMTGCHVASNNRCVYLEQSAQFRIAQCDFYPNAPVVGPYLGIEVGPDCEGGSIVNNNFIRPNTTAEYTAIKLTGGIGTLIDQNTFEPGSSAGCVGINITAGATGTRIGASNFFKNVHTKIISADKHERYMGGPETLKQSGVAVSHTGNTNETILETVTIPGKSLGANGWAEVYALFSFTNNANNKTPRIRLGGIAGGGIYSLAVASQAGLAVERIVQNRNNPSSQVCFPFGTTTSYGVTGGAVTVNGQNTDNDLDLVFTGQLANAADTITLEGYFVKVAYRP